MGRNKYLLGGIAGGGSAGLACALLWLGAQTNNLPFIPFVWFEWLARNLPGSVVTSGIDLMVALIRSLRLGPTSATAKLAEQWMGIGLFLFVGVFIGLFLSWINRNQLKRLVYTAAAASLVLFIFTIYTLVRIDTPNQQILPIGVISAFVLLLWMAGLVGILYRPKENSGELEILTARRTFLTAIGIGSAAFAAILVGVGSRNRRPTPVTGEIKAPTIDVSMAQGSPSQAELDRRIEPAPGTRSEVTPIEDFYRIDINLDVPHVEPSTWRLELKGLFETPAEFTLDELRSFPATSQIATLSCISNYVGGDLIGTALWTGVRFRDLIEQVGIQPEVTAFDIESLDGFYESVPIVEAMDDQTILVYAMAGQPLTDTHGFPLRIYIPNHYGMKQPKWIRSIEAVKKGRIGFWVDRGWDPWAVVRTTSVVDAVAAGHKEGDVIPVGGIAYSGARGISKVEIQVDDGEWVPTELRTPGLSPLTWIQWRYDWPAARGGHTFRVRAYDGDGELQITSNNEPHPSGSTGIHSRTINVLEP